MFVAPTGTESPALVTDEMSLMCVLSCLHVSGLVLHQRPGLRPEASAGHPQLRGELHTGTVTLPQPDKHTHTHYHCSYWTCVCVCVVALSLSQAAIPLPSLAGSLHPSCLLLGEFVLLLFFFRPIFLLIAD